MAVAPVTDQAPVIPTPPATPTDCNAVKGYDWNTDVAYAVCMAESTGNPDATGYNTNGTIDRGLMQVNSIHSDMVGGDVAALYDPATNIKIAYALSRGGTDWTPWSAYNSGKYLKWL